MKGINMRVWKFLGGVAVVFAGCSSFNRYTYITPQQQQEQVQQQEHAERIEKKATDIALRGICPKAAFKPLPREPQIPRQKWASTNNDRALEEAMMDHIAAQQRYIAQLKAQINGERTDYAVRCAEFTRRQAERPSPNVPAAPAAQ
jgi:hypothetical protein